LRQWTTRTFGSLGGDMPIHYDITKTEPDLSEATAFIVEAKRLARHYRELWARRGIELGHSECLELVSIRHGARDWNTLHASLRGGGILRQFPGGYREVLVRVLGLPALEKDEVGIRLSAAIRSAIYEILSGGERDEALECAPWLGGDDWWGRMQEPVEALAQRLIEIRDMGRPLTYMHALVSAKRDSDPSSVRVTLVAALAQLEVEPKSNARR
jgi:hypothetical protein